MTGKDDFPRIGHAFETCKVIVLITGSPGNYQLFLGIQSVVGFDEIIAPFFRHYPAGEKAILPGDQTQGSDVTPAFGAFINYDRIRDKTVSLP